MYRISTRLVFLSVALLVLGAISGTLWVRGVAGATRTLSQKATADGVWEEIDRTPMRQVAVEAAGTISYRLLRLNRDILSSVLIRAPREMAERSIAGDTSLILPLPAGGYGRFRIEESPVLAPELAAELPEVRSFRGRGIEDSAMWLRFDLTPHGFHALVTSNKETFTIHPANAEGDGLYVVYAAEDYRAVIEDFSCRVIEQVQAEDKVASKATVLEKRVLSARRAPVRHCAPIVLRSQRRRSTPMPLRSAEEPFQEHWPRSIPGLTV